MKKSSFVAMILGTIGGILFALGMCMALIPEWNAFRPGVIMGVVGAVVLLIMVLVWRKMEHKDPIPISGRTIRSMLLGIAGARSLGAGRGLTLVWGTWAVVFVFGRLVFWLWLCRIPLKKG